jgi:trans-2,3-dihydro-3-hydroxyanthranilate isomerase
MPRSVQIVRVFTRGELGGNPLGVVNDVTGLEDPQMQAIAHELGFSETTFVDWETGDVPAVRIFTPQVEMEFAGHPLVGTSWVINVLGPGGVTEMRCPVGVVTTRVDGDLVWIDTSLGQPVSPAGDDLVRRAGLPEPRTCWTVAMPKPYIVAGYDDFTTVVSLAPDLDVVRETFGLLTYARTGDAVRARFFAPAGGVDEDPATGSAAVALAAALSSEGETAGSLEIAQGEEIEAPSTIRLMWSDGVASIGGTVVRDEARFLET